MQCLDVLAEWRVKPDDVALSVPARLTVLHVACIPACG